MSIHLNDLLVYQSRGQMVINLPGGNFNQHVVFGAEDNRCYVSATCICLFLTNPFGRSTLQFRIFQIFSSQKIEVAIGTGHEVGQIKSKDPEIVKKLDASDEWKKLSKTFGKLHGLSTSINLLCLCLSTVHLWNLTEHL